MLSESELICVINRQYERLNDVVDDYDRQRLKDFINGMECVLND